MGNSASSQGSSTGTDDGDVGSSILEGQHDWPIEQAADIPDTQSLQEMRKPYNGASNVGLKSSTEDNDQRAAREERDMPNRKQKKSVRKDEDKSPILQDDNSSSGDERDVIPEDQRRHQPTLRPRPRSPPPQIDSSSSDEEEQHRCTDRQRKKTR